ncbi:MAG TPA: hypothetical protein VHO90_16775, partial [Bacteroidales bacterium]|nr:hypothetical protein [Bacteroidales bacterium]
QVNAEVVGLRDMVRSKNPSVEIAEAFGIGNRIILTVGGVTAAANVLMDGYKKFPAWAKKAGILDTDITKLTGLVTSLGVVEKQQDDSMFTRKAKTMGKDELQRAVEDEVTSLSAIGAYVFHDVDPATSRLFEDLIPSSAKEKDEEKPEPKTTTNA